MFIVIYLTIEFRGDNSMDKTKIEPDWYKLTGKLDFPLTNDYLFRALLQKNNNTLKGLIAALLHIDFYNISSVRITNEIPLGETIDAKHFILDINVIMNEGTLINLEMQVINEKNWVERSMSYLCRSYDNLNGGASYTDAKPAIQIGLLDYTLFPERPEFYATYYLSNEKTHEKYSDKLRLSVLDLTRIDLATEEDSEYAIDYWARFFKATTWEELKMIATGNEIISDAVTTVYNTTNDQLIRDQIRARNEAIAYEKYMQNQLAAHEKTIAEKDKQLAEKDAIIESLMKQLAEAKAQ